jgi:hypothetical protein
MEGGYVEEKGDAHRKEVMTYADISGEEAKVAAAAAALPFMRISAPCNADDSTPPPAVQPTCLTLHSGLTAPTPNDASPLIASVPESAPTSLSWEQAAADLRRLLKTAELDAAAAAANEQRFPWNARFIAALEEKNRLERNRALSSYDEDFRRLAERDCRTIIAELALDGSRKTIKPVSLGGIAGGMKFIHDGILFKFPQVGLSDVRGPRESELLLFPPFLCVFLRTRLLR